MKRLGVASFVLGGAALLAHSASAQVCDTNCPIRARDARGCCPTGAPPNAPTPAPPAATPAKTPARPAATAKSSCPAGQEITVDTSGHCCWPGQAWSGTQCVGAPSSCPEGYHVDASAQVCALEACSGGKTRAPDNVHCCWPGQAWSSRGECVGRPSCPAGMEPEGDSCVSDDLDGDGVPNGSDKCPNEAEDKDGFQDNDGCPDPDNDADGILDANDKCPNDPEDKNGYKDDDGCPDEQERLAVVSAQARANTARAEKEARERQLADEQAQRRATERAAAEAEADRVGRQTTGWWLAGGGVALAGIGGAFALLSDGTNSTIKEGGLATAAEIKETNERGEAFDIAAVTFAAIGGVLLTIGVPLVVFNLAPSKSAAPAVGGIGPATGPVRLSSRGVTLTF